MNRLMARVSVFLALSSTCAQAQNPPVLPQYQPEQQVTETLRSWGSNDMANLMQAWEKGFSKYHPQARYSDTLKGTETAQAALYTEVADLALMDREILTLERHVMLRRKHSLPLEIAVATGGFEAPNRTFALAVFVHKDNPITKLTLKQLDGIFGEQRSGAWDDKFKWHAELARSLDSDIRTWGQVGLTGEWADKPIQVYGYPVTNYSPVPGPMLFFRTKAFGGGDMWNPNMLEYEKGDQITAALSHDRYGIAYTALSYHTPSIKAVALGSKDGDFIDLTRQNVASRKYPLTRSIYIYIDRTPHQPVMPKVKEFLRYILSRQGQEVVTIQGDYLPLTAELVAEQLKKLD